MEKIVIVVGDRKNPHAHHIKLSGTVRIGRAFSNEIILSDDYSEPLQLAFHVIEEEGQSPRRTVEVFSSINPVLRNGEAVNPGSYDFVSGDEWSFGRTQLQAFSEAHAPEPTEKLVMKEYRGKNAMQALVFITTLASLFGWVLLKDWLDNVDVIEWDKNMASSATNGFVLLVFVWAAFWGVVGRIITGRNQFNIHFVASTLAFLLFLFNDALSQYLAYGTNRDGLWTFYNHVVFALLCAALVHIAFSYALNLRKMKYAALATGVFLSAFVYFSDMANTKPLEPHFNQGVKPPFAILVKPESVEQFRTRMDEAFAAANKAAQ